MTKAENAYLDLRVQFKNLLEQGYDISNSIFHCTGYTVNLCKDIIKIVEKKQKFLVLDNSLGIYREDDFHTESLVLERIRETAKSKIKRLVEFNNL